MSITINIYADDCHDNSGSGSGGGGASIREGAIDPGINTVRKVARSIEKRVKQDREFAKSFRERPSLVLSAYGLNEDIRRELIREASLAATDCDFLSCISTCWYTCIFTDWFSAADVNRQ